jgi:DNA-binding GntR family transcriptional regulator
VKENTKRLVDALSSWSTRPGVLHERLTTAIQDAVRQGSIYPGMRLPSERHLARMLSISRTTVVASYNDLRAGGWLESRVGSGTWIAKRKASLVRASIHAARSPAVRC